MLFPEIVFGPIHSRRLGSSLGVNLLPQKSKVCSFECVYCECGFTENMGVSPVPTLAQVSSALEQKLSELSAKNVKIDVITFAGNGEPTLHPHFAEIIDKTIELRNRFYPQAKVSVLSNATRAHKPDVHAALQKIDNNILKIDSAIEQTVRVINQPNSPDFSIQKVIDTLATFDNVIVQTLFFTGDYNGHHIDNTTDQEVSAWLAALDKIKPREVQVYSLDRATPAEHLQKASPEVLTAIANRAREAGHNVLLTL